MSKDNQRLQIEKVLNGYICTYLVKQGRKPGLREMLANGEGGEGPVVKTFCFSGENALEDLLVFLNHLWGSQDPTMQADVVRERREVSHE